MRRGAYILVLVSLSAGCACHKPAPTEPAPIAQVSYEPAAAASLAFDPPVYLGQPPLELSRDLRSPEAFVGYEATATYFYLRLDDRQTEDIRNDRYERRSISHKFGVSYR